MISQSALQSSRFALPSFNIGLVYADLHFFKYVTSNSEETYNFSVVLVLFPVVYYTTAKSSMRKFQWPLLVHSFYYEDFSNSFDPINLQEPCVLYTGRAHRYPPNTPFYIFFQQIYVLNFLNILHTLRFFFSSKCRLFHNATFFWFLYYSHFTYRVC